MRTVSRCSFAMVLVALLVAPASAVDMSGRWFVRYFLGGTWGPFDEHWDVTQS